MFDADGYGYEIIDGSHYTLGYTNTETKLILRENYNNGYHNEYYESELEYELLDGGKILMLYGMDDDLSILRYTKVK